MFLEKRDSARNSFGFSPISYEARDSARNTSGFTLIEILVVFGLMMIVTMISVSFYNNFKAKEGVREAVSVLASNLRLARGKALLVQKPDVSCDDLDYWWLKVSGGSMDYGYFCDGGEDYTYSLVTDFSSDTGVNNFIVKFLPLTGVEMDGGETITVSSVAVSGYSEQITVESSGIIKEPREPL